MSTRITQTDIIQSGKLSGIKVGNHELIELDSDHLLSDFNPRSLITRDAVEQLINDPIPIFNVERINFENINGQYSLDFTVNNRQNMYLYPDVQIWQSEGSIETRVIGYGLTKNISSGQIISLLIDGVFGSGYILLYTIQ